MSHLIPNSGRIIVQLLKPKTLAGSLIIPRDNAKIGENLQMGEVIDGGDTMFKKGQLVTFAEFSMLGVYPNIRAVVNGEVPASVYTSVSEQVHIIPADDVVAVYNEESNDTRPVRKKVKAH